MLSQEGNRFLFDLIFIPHCKHYEFGVGLI